VLTQSHGCRGKKKPNDGECQIFCVSGFREGGSVVGSRISRTPPCWLAVASFSGGRPP
jgi:hypothetical protein